MPPKFDPNEEKIVTLRCVGGEVGAASTLAPKVGPLGLSPKKIGEDIMNATLEWKGLNVTVMLRIKMRQATVELVPSASSLIAKNIRDNGHASALGGDLSMDQIIDISRTMRSRSLARKLAGTVCEILGTCRSMGCTVDGMAPADVTAGVQSEKIPVPEE